MKHRGVPKSNLGIKLLFIFIIVVAGYYFLNANAIKEGADTYTRLTPTARPPTKPSTPTGRTTSPNDTDGKKGGKTK